MEEAKDIKKPTYKSLLIENVKFKTLLPDKYQQKKPFVRKDIKKITAFIPGIVTKILVKKGKKVKIGDVLLKLEAMKMENNIVSPIDGTIKQVNIKEGTKVTKKEVLIELV
ncbi:MAG: biotin/lipoyl-containing protein [Bacteroidales bacterium]